LPTLQRDMGLCRSRSELCYDRTAVAGTCASAADLHVFDGTGRVEHFFTHVLLPCKHRWELGTAPLSRKEVLRRVCVGVLSVCVC
jgi:hypothetical protein